MSNQTGLIPGVISIHKTQPDVVRLSTKRFHFGVLNRKSFSDQRYNISSQRMDLLTATVKDLIQHGRI